MSALSTRTIKTSRPRIASAVRKTVEASFGKSPAEMLGELKKHRSSSSYTDKELLSRIRGVLSSNSKPKLTESRLTAEIVIFDDEDDDGVLQQPVELNLIDFDVVQDAPAPAIIAEQEEIHLDEVPAPAMNEIPAEEFHVNIIEEFDEPLAQVSPLASERNLTAHIEELERKNAALCESLQSALAQIEETSQTIAKVSRKLQKKMDKQMETEILVTVVQPPQENAREIAKIIAFGVPLIIVYYLLFCT